MDEAMKRIIAQMLERAEKPAYLTTFDQSLIKLIEAWHKFYRAEISFEEFEAVVDECWAMVDIAHDGDPILTEDDENYVDGLIMATVQE